jgi:hypothetical protein
MTRPRHHAASVRTPFARMLAMVIGAIGCINKTPLIRRGFSFRSGLWGYFTLMFSADSLHEHIFAAALRLHESISLSRVEPLHGTAVATTLSTVHAVKRAGLSTLNEGAVIEYTTAQTSYGRALTPDRAQNKKPANPMVIEPGAKTQRRERSRAIRAYATLPGSTLSVGGWRSRSDVRYAPDSDRNIAVPRMT